MFCLHGNGRDQTRPYGHRTVSRLIITWFEGFLCVLKHKVYILPGFQVQEAHGLQEEETAASNKKTTLSPSSSDVTQGQLSRAARPEL